MVCPKWRADDLDGEVRKAVMAWEPEQVKQIRPIETGLTLEQQMENAEKTFLTEARVVSTVVAIWKTWSRFCRKSSACAA